jgi:hypothetical protein
MSACGKCSPSNTSRVLPWIAKVCAFAVILLPYSLGAQQDERAIRAAFVYNLTKYVTWPQSNHDLNICVLGGGATGQALAHVVEGKESAGRIVHVLLQPSEDALRHCEIAYFTQPISDRESSAFEKMRNSSILTVGEDDRFVRAGGMVGFVRSGDAIQIEINTDAVHRCGLQISSRLLDLAIIYHGGKRG